MNKAQVIADLSFQLTSITTAERAQAAVRRAVRVAGLTNATRLDDSDMQNLLQALAAEGGLIEELVQRLAMQSASRGLPPYGSAGSGDVPKSAA